MSPHLNRFAEEAAAYFIDMLGRGEGITIDGYLEAFPPAMREQMRPALEAAVALDGWAKRLKKRGVPSQEFEDWLKPQSPEEEIEEMAGGSAGEGREWRETAPTVPNLVPCREFSAPEDADAIRRRAWADLLFPEEKQSGPKPAFRSAPKKKKKRR